MERPEAVAVNVDVGLPRSDSMLVECGGRGAAGFKSGARAEAFTTDSEQELSDGKVATARGVMERAVILFSQTGARLAPKSE